MLWTRYGAINTEKTQFRNICLFVLDFQLNKHDIFGVFNGYFVCFHVSVKNNRMILKNEDLKLNLVLCFEIGHKMARPCASERNNRYPC